MEIEEIINFFCQERGVSPSAICGTSRTSDIWITRYMIWLYLHCNIGMSATRLSKYFNRNRPSIFRGIRIIKHDFKYHKELCAEYRGIVTKIEDLTNTKPSCNMEEKN